MGRAKSLVGGAFALLAVAGCATVPTEPEDGGRTVETVCEFSREAEPEGLSGITRIGGNRYYSVDDRGGFLHEALGGKMTVGEFTTVVAN